MSNLSTYIFSALSADAPLVALVGSRIYPLIAPAGVSAPYITHTRIGTVPTESHEAPSGLDMVSVQFSCFARNFTAAEQIAAALRVALESATPPDGGSIHFVDTRHFFESETELHNIQLDADFWHTPNN